MMKEKWCNIPTKINNFREIKEKISRMLLKYSLTKSNNFILIIILQNGRNTKYVGTNLVFCYSSAPPIPLTAGMTDRRTDEETDRYNSFKYLKTIIYIK